MTLFEQPHGAAAPPPAPTEAFGSSADAGQQRPRRLGRGTLFGTIALVVALIAMLVMSFLPSGYVVQQPGPVINTLGQVTVSEQEVPMIEVSDAETYPTAGTLSLTTVSVLGNRDRTSNWFELLLAWFDPSRAILPVDAVFPPDQTSEEVDAQNQQLMVDSQAEASAAALRELGYQVTGIPTIASVAEDGPAAGSLQVGDEIVSVGGTATTTFAQVKDAVVAAGGGTVTFVVRRDGTEHSFTLTPKATEVDGAQTWMVGVGMMMTFDLPVDVHIQLERIGGPSAGMMFALGIIDVLTPGELNGGAAVAGTGTIDDEGNVGAIGGIRQKLYGAANSGATYFLAPASNCDEVVGHIPDGLQVIATSTLAESVSALETIASGTGIADLPSCTTASTPAG